MFKIQELPEYIQSLLPHLIVKDEKKNGELQSESYYAFSPEMIRWVNENREAYSECPTILLTCDELSKASLYYNSCAYESVPGEESFVLRFVVRKVEYPLQLSILIYDYLTACNIEGFNPGNVAIGGNRNAPFYMELHFTKKNRIIMKSPEQLAAAIKQVSDLCTENDMPAIFVGTVKANDDVTIISYPGHDTSTDQGIDSVVRQLYQAAMRTPKSHLGTIILNVAAAICVANPEINKLFMEDIGKKQAQMEFERIREDVKKQLK